MGVARRSRLVCWGIIRYIGSCRLSQTRRLLASVVPSIKTVTMLAQLHILATLHLRGFALVLGKADSTLIVPTKPIACRWPRRAFPRSSGHDEGGLGRGL